MVEKTKRKLSNRTTRSMLTWSHYQFRELLKAKVTLNKKSTLIICDEHYTSKTCGNCGQVNHNLGASKTFNCTNCSYVADRDANGARNILLKYLSRT